MKNRSRDKFILLLLVIVSFISILNYIKLNEIENFGNRKVDYSADNFFFESTCFLDTSYELLCTDFIKNVPNKDINCHFEEISRNYEDFVCIFITSTLFSVELFGLLKNFSIQEAPRECIPQEIEGVKLTEVERKIFEVIQEFLNYNRVFNKEKVAMYIKSRYKVNGNLNYNGIRVVIDSLIKKNIILEGSKLTRESVLLNSNRNQIFNLIKEHPGIYKNNMTKRLNLSPYVINWHLSMLIKFHLIRGLNFDSHIGYFEFSMSSQNDKILHTISKDKCMNIIEFLILNNKGCTKYRIAKVLHMHYNTITKYLNKLEEFNLLIRKKDGNKECLFLNVINFKKLINQEKN